MGVAPLAFRAIMTLPQPSAFSPILRGGGIASARAAGDGSPTLAIRSMRPSLQTTRRSQRGSHTGTEPAGTFLFNVPVVGSKYPSSSRRKIFQ